MTLFVTECLSGYVGRWLWWGGG